jgi:hypothetical protein
MNFRDLWTPCDEHANPDGLIHELCVKCTNATMRALMDSLDGMLATSRRQAELERIRKNPGTHIRRPPGM